MSGPRCTVPVRLQTRAWSRAEHCRNSTHPFCPLRPVLEPPVEPACPPPVPGVRSSCTPLLTLQQDVKMLPKCGVRDGTAASGGHSSPVPLSVATASQRSAAQRPSWQCSACRPGPPSSVHNRERLRALCRNQLRFRRLSGPHGAVEHMTVAPARVLGQGWGRRPARRYPSCKGLGYRASPGSKGQARRSILVAVTL